MHLTSRDVSFPRRQQLRRLRRAAVSGVGACAALALVLSAAASEAYTGATVMLLVSAALGVDARQHARLAARSGVGARSEAEVRHALQVLECEGWRLRSSLAWQGRGDVDHVAIAPTGVAFAIETKCAARRPVVSPVQPGGTRREVLGSDGLPGSER